MTPLALVPDTPEICGQCGQPFTARACGPTHATLAAEQEDPRLAKLRALMEGPETPVEALGNVLMALQSWVTLNDQDRAGEFGLAIICNAVERLTYVRGRLLDAERNPA